MFVCVRLCSFVVVHVHMSLFAIVCVSFVLIHVILGLFVRVCVGLCFFVFVSIRPCLSVLGCFCESPSVLMCSRPCLFVLVYVDLCSFVSVCVRL